MQKSVQEGPELVRAALLEITPIADFSGHFLRQSNTFFCDIRYCYIILCK